MAKLPIHKRIQDAVDKIGSHNGTRIPDATLPDSIDQKNNVAVNAFFDNHAIVKEYYILDVIKKHVEGRHKAVKAQVLLKLGIKEDALAAGDARTFQFDNMNLTYKVTAGRANLNREHLLSVLMVQLSKIVPGAKNLSLEDAQKVIEAATVTGKPPLTLTPATTVE